MAGVMINREFAKSQPRTTVEGRKLTYELAVIQQPERARACGSGAKSSADRRPVDPPPVVELRIFEGEGANKVDITFSYDASFFCHASLLPAARSSAHGRVGQPTQQPPVLTGVAVSGMAYLDRPAEAGYFIFPDLSVRHEGKYCLKFSVYEHTKNAKDETIDSVPTQAELAQPPPNGLTGHVSFVLEVTSAPFTVFSAKKFPGLAESTILSRTVAEQGCRVRIRRDVRMRRREGKGGADYDDYEETSYPRGRSVTPTDPSDFARQRSTSNTSVGRQQPYEAHRRPSEYEAPYSATQQQGPPFLGFGAQAASQPQCQNSQFVPPAHSAPQSQQHCPPYHQAAQFRSQQNQSSSYYPDRQSYPGYQPYETNEFRRPSLNYPALPPAYSAEQDAARPAAAYSAYQTRSENPVLPPINVAAPPTLDSKYEGLTSPAGPMPANGTASNLASPGYQDRPYGTFPTSAPAEPRGSKRSFESSFPSSTYNQPLHNGMRPSSSHGASPAFQETDDGGIDAFTMQYRRADGSAQNRELPSLS